MKCPYCGNDDLKVLDSRPGSDGESIRRRRECVKCNKRFTTSEKLERAKLFVIKKDGSRTEFSREKVIYSMTIACRKRPISTEVLQQAAARIEEELYRQFDDEMTSKQVGLAVMRELSTIDTVAYVRFASVYQEFETVADFAEMAENVQREEALSPFRHLQPNLINQ
jgi:transcriptional repressor NrdR